MICPYQDLGQPEEDWCENPENCEIYKERIQEKEKLAKRNLMLTAEQREALEMLLDACFVESLLSIEDFWKCERAVQSLLSGSKPAWEVTEERIAAMKDACNFLVYAEIRNKGVNPGNVDRAKNAEDVLRAMLAGGKRDA